MAWLDAIIKYQQAYAKIDDIRSISPVPAFGILVFCVENGRAYYWAPSDSTTDDGATALQPNNAIDSSKGRWKFASFGAIGTVTLGGDASGSSASNLVTHVTGTTDTVIGGTNTVTTAINGSTVFTVDASGALLQSVRLRTGAGVPSATDPNGSLYLRTDGDANTALYMREGGSWVVIGGASAVTLGGDVTGPSGTNKVIQITGGTNGVHILEPSANPTSASGASGGALLFPSALGPTDQLRWLQGDGFGIVMSASMNETPNATVSVTKKLFTFGPPNSGYVQAFIGNIIVFCHIVTAPFDCFARVKVPFCAYTYDSGTTHTVIIHRIGVLTQKDFAVGFSTCTLNSGYECYAKNNSVYATDSTSVVSTLDASHMPTVTLIDSSDGSYRSVSATIGRPNISGTDTFWTSGFGSYPWRCRIMVEGAWYLEPSRDPAKQ